MPIIIEFSSKLPLEQNRNTYWNLIIMRRIIEWEISETVSHPFPILLHSLAPSLLFFERTRAFKFASICGIFRFVLNHKTLSLGGYSALFRCSTRWLDKAEDKNQHYTRQYRSETFFIHDSWFWFKTIKTSYPRLFFYVFTLEKLQGDIYIY